MHKAILFYQHVDWSLEALYNDDQTRIEEKNAITCGVFGRTRDLLRTIFGSDVFFLSIISMETGFLKKEDIDLVNIL